MTRDPRQRILDEIRAIVADAVATGDILWVGPTCPTPAQDPSEFRLVGGPHIADELILAASAARVPLEISRVH